jgi:hypothetical protein
MNLPDAPIAHEGFYVRILGDPDGYLIEVVQYKQLALDHFKNYAG